MGSIVATEAMPRPLLTGGALIGSSAVMVMGLFGKIAGIARGLVGLLPGVDGPENRFWPLAFLVGSIAGSVAVGLVTGSLPTQSAPANLAGMAIAGLLAGAGTAFGSGCTSGHGVCGLARLSPRSLAAGTTFAAAAVLTTTIARHVF